MKKIPIIKEDVVKVYMRDCQKLAKEGKDFTTEFQEWLTKLYDDEGQPNLAKFVSISVLALSEEGNKESIKGFMFGAKGVYEMIKRQIEINIMEDTA